MTTLAFMSDLHIDLNNFTDFETKTLIALLKEEGIDHLHIAGDISNHHYQVSLPFLETLQQHVSVTYNLGNHDMLDLTETDIEHLDFKIHEINTKKFLAFHGWYDYSFHPEKTEEQNLAFKNQFWFDRRLDRHASDNKLTEETLSRLDDTLTHYPEIDLVSMHFVPHQNFLMTHPKFIPFNAFLGSQAFHDVFVKHHIKDVIFGHAHRSYGSQMIDGINYHSRPLGYRREWDLTIDYVNQHPELNPTGTWNLSKRYHLVKRLPDYQNYTKKQLKEEFRKSITVFDF
ncbi:phosphoesterase [Streptococcus pluranimalium]|uniref:phosphoesterase n=1 Tax=Streptococcus pluranimalium TaxID=82348 RepID=UPI002A7A82C4|nr:phosphoesterase [Streptococcus pluranimalium]